MKNLFVLFLALVLTDTLPAQQWKGLSFTFVGRDTFLIPYDGANPKAKLRVVNTSGTYTPTRIIPRSVPPAGYSESGFATFPNGGYVYLAPFETTYVTCWLRGVYERQIPSGIFTREVGFTFRRNVSDDTSSFTISKVYVFNNLGQNVPPSGPLTVSGKVLLPTLPARGPVNVTVGTIHETASVSTTPIDSGVQFSTTIPSRDDFYVGARSDGFKMKYHKIDPKSPTNIRLVLEPLPPMPVVSFQYLTSFKTSTGFWRGVASESEKTVAFFPGQENWRMNGPCLDSATVAQSKIYKCTFSGQVLWTYSTGWDTWGGDMSRDGKYVVYTLNTGKSPGCYGPPWTIALLDGTTGNKIWEKTNEKIYESYEVDISNDSRYIAVGTSGGQVSLLDRATGNVLWSKPPLTEPAGADTGFGQVRKLRFDARDEFLYSSSGDTYLRKIRVSDGALMWKTNVWGWAWINGLNFSPDGSKIVAGTKSGDVTMVRTSDGKILWTTETGNFEDVVFSPNGKLVATFTGRIFEALTGEIVGQTRYGAPPYFANDSVLCKLANEVAVFAPTGELIYRSANPTDISSKPGEQVQWAYLSSDLHAILAARDMSTPPQTGVVFYSGSITQPVVIAQFSSKNLSFGNVSVGQFKDLALSITNSGNATLTISSIVSNNAAFRTRLNSGTVSAGQTLTDTIQFFPPSAGAFTGAIIVTSNSSTSPDTITVSGRGVGTAGIGFATRIINFGSVAAGRSKDTTLSVTSNGTDTLKVLSVTSTSAVFAARPTSFTLAAQRTIADTIRFTPTTVGAFSGNLIYSSNAASSPDTVNLIGQGVAVSAVEKLEGIPTTYSLSQNFPNPFNPITTIRYAIPHQGRVRLEIYSALGQPVVTLINELHEPGNYQVRCSSVGFSSGVYFYRLKAGEFVETKKMTVIK